MQKFPTKKYSKRRNFLKKLSKVWYVFDNCQSSVDHQKLGMKMYCNFTNPSTIPLSMWHQLSKETALFEIKSRLSATESP